jgi:hypothetical protein
MQQTHHKIPAPVFQILFANLVYPNKYLDSYARKSWCEVSGIVVRFQPKLVCVDST